MKNIRRYIARLKTAMKKGSNFKATLEEDITNDVFPSSPIPNVKTYNVVYLIIKNGPKEMGI